MRSIPFFKTENLGREDIEEHVSRFRNLLETGVFVLDAAVIEFEKSVANLLGAEHGIGVNSGLDALVISLEAAKISGILKPGDEVICPANTYFATVLAILRVGLVPVLVEPSEATMNIDVEMALTKISKKTRGVMLVHLYGRVCDAPELIRFAKENGLFIIEDVAQAVGAKTADGISAGSIGNVGCLSFYPTKNLGAFGDGGAICVTDNEMSELIRSLRNYGQSAKYEFKYLGFNSRLDEIQALILIQRLRGLERVNSTRRSNAALYSSLIRNDRIIKPVPSAEDVQRLDEGHIWHQYVIRCKSRDRLRNYLNENGVQTLIHYPIPPHLQAAYAPYMRRGDRYPVTEMIHAQALSLPIASNTDREDIEYICELINAFE